MAIMISLISIWDPPYCSSFPEVIILKLNMKRTREALYRPNPTHGETQDSSGVTFVIGEDLNYHQRARQNQLLQKEYLDEQVQQRNLQKQAEKCTNTQWDQQLLKTTQHRGQLEMNKHQRLHEMERAHDQFNLNAANEKKERERLQRERQLEEERRQLALLKQRQVRNYNPRAN